MLKRTLVLILCMFILTGAMLSACSNGSSGTADEKSNVSSDTGSKEAKKAESVEINYWGDSDPEFQKFVEDKVTD